MDDISEATKLNLFDEEDSEVVSILHNYQNFT
jgi:hypothetical protein